MLQSRRSFIRGFGASLIAAPVVVRAASLMPIRGIVQDWREGFTPLPSEFSYAGLTAITRAAFLPRLFVQVYQHMPLGSWLEELEQERARL